MNRRLFLGSLLASAAIDPEKSIWVPGRKMISIPAPPPPSPFSEAEWERAFAFCYGDQWPEEIKAARYRAGRPVVTVNKMFHVVAKEAHQRKVNYEGWKALIVETYRKHADSQRALNLLVSNHVEGMLWTTAAAVALAPAANPISRRFDLE